MTSTFNDVRAVIEGRIATEMSNSPSYPVASQNVPFVPPNTTPWIETNVSFGENSYATLMGPSTGFNRQSGVLIVNVFTPIGVGAGANFTIAERVKDLFDRLRLSGIIFEAASGPAQVLPAEPESYFQTRLSVGFEAYLD